MIHGQIKPLFNTPINWGHPLAQGLVASYLMNEGCGDLVHDSCGMNDGRMINMAPMSPTSGWVPGPHGGALALDGSNDYVNCGNDASLNPANGITIEAWVLFNNITDNAGIVYRGDFQGSQGVYNFILAGSALYFRLNNGVASFWASAPSQGIWHHVVATYDKNLTSANMKIFIDSVLKSTKNYTTPMDLNLNNTLIGAYYSVSYTHDGPISSVSIYNRALSAEEIAYLYAFPWCMYEAEKGMQEWLFNQQNRNPSIGSIPSLPCIPFLGYRGI